MAQLLAVHPVIEVGDVRRAIAWYVGEMGFEIAFTEGSSPPDYVGLQRDGVEIHLQTHDEPGWVGQARGNYRFVVDDPDALLAELRGRGQAFADRRVQNTTWGTREFGQYDPDGNGIFFYRNLRNGELVIS